MQCGTPNVTTSVGYEGMCGENEWSGLIEDTAESFAEAAVQLYTKKGDWLVAQQNGDRILKERFAKSSFEEDLIERIEWMLKNMETHRLNNFIGSMLSFHNARSTKYMALWIEAKNKISKF